MTQDIMEQQGKEDPGNMGTMDDVTAIVNVLDGAITKLIRRRDDAYERAIARLKAEQATLRQEYSAIGETASKLEAFLPAKARVAQYEADCLTIEGNDTGARAKLQEMESAKRAPAVMRERQQEITLRIATLEEEKRNIVRRVFHQWLDVEVRSIVATAERGYFKLLRDVEESCDSFQEATGTGRDVSNPGSRGLYHWGNLLDLTSNEKSLEWATAMRWYGGNGGRRR